MVFFAAYRHGRVVGTLSVLEEGETAWFGHLQAEDTPDVLPALWEAVVAQAAPGTPRP